MASDDSSTDCEHSRKQYTGALYDGPGGKKSWLYYSCPDCKARWREEERKAEPDPKRELCGYCDAGLPQACTCPPLTPEEEEEAPEDRCTCGETACESELCDCDSAPCPVDHAREGEQPPPQPERRPPLLVAYAVQGHLYEVAVPGDVTVRAVDGALVITHPLGPVAGICQVAPMTSEESA